MKRKIINILIVILFIISILFNIIFIIDYIRCEYYSTPRYGYYVNKSLGITNVEVLEHNAPFECCFVGKNNSEMTIKILFYIYEMNSINYDNNIKTISISFEDNFYEKIGLEELNSVISVIKESNLTYFINANYNQQTGLVNEIIINKI